MPKISKRNLKSIKYNMFIYSTLKMFNNILGHKNV